MSWQAASLIVLSLALVAGLGWYERDKPPARVLALAATLAALAVVGRLAFAAIPNVKPTTDIVLFAGYSLGAVPGFAVGAVTALVSNLFLSQGPWTPWQMAGWGAVAIAGAVLAWTMRGREVNRFVLAAVCGVAGLAFGAWMDLYQLTLAARQDLETYLAISAASLPYNLAHAIGNVLFCLLIGPVFIRSLRRYRRRLEVSWRASVGASTAAVLIVLLVPAGAGAASPAERAERWLLRAQNEDGGFGGVPNAKSSELFSGWSALGLAASGRNPRDVRRPGGRSLAAYVSSGALTDVGRIERTMLALEAAGLSSRKVRGKDLVAALTRRRRANGSIAGYVSYTAFGVLALRAAGAPAGSSTVRWLVSAQNDDGGFGLSPGSASESDMTGAVLQALAAVGRSRGAAVRRAVAWLRDNQNGDGGFGQFKGRSSNAQSTSFAVQGLVAAGAGGATLTRSIRYLRGLQRSNGSIAYSSSSSQTPVWVTAQALMALEREPLPLAAVPRRERKPQADVAEEQAPAAAPPAPSASEAPPAVDAGTAPGGGADAGAAPGGEADGGTPAAPGKDSSQPSVPGITAEPPADEPPASAPADGGLRVDPGEGEAAGASGEGGPAAWLVALLLGAAGLAVLLIRPRLPRLTHWLHTLNPWFEKP